MPIERTRGWAARLNDVALAGGVVAVISLIVLPVPPFLLDTLIAFNLAASVVLLLLTIYVRTPLNLSTFPSLLLFTTLLRLALNIASSKQILLHAHAGHIIDAFGRLVVGGNVVVGLVVFSIISVVQFIVIAKGAERVAEVGARFTLDAMPGKQLSIDADLRNHHITQVDARARRTQLEQESQLHGAMDGAMKFVKGDAIAGLIIAAVNIVAGVAIGTLMQGSTLSEATTRYTILTVGDGMVSQIPSLFVSVAAGILITRVSGQDEGGHLGHEIAHQVLAHPIALLMTSAVLLGFSLVPGFPGLQFMALGLGAFGAGFVLRRQHLAAQTGLRTPMPSLRREGSTRMQPLIDPSAGSAVVVLAVGEALPARLAPRRLDELMAAQRRALLEDTGVPFPGLSIRTDARLPALQWRLLVNDVEVAAGPWGQALEYALQTPAAPAPGGAGTLGLDVWCRASAGPAAQDFESLLAFLVARAIRRHAGQMLGMQEVQSLLRAAEGELPELVQEALKAVPLPRITEVLRRLVDEGVPIRNLRVILEALVNWAGKEKDNALLAEQVRIDLGRYIARARLGSQRHLRAITLDPVLEERMAGSIQQSIRGTFMMLDPLSVDDLRTQLAAALQRHAGAGGEPVLVSGFVVRRFLHKMLASRFPSLAVLSFEELAGHVDVEVLDVIGGALQ